MKRPTILEKLPKHMHPFVAKQDASLYTAFDHAAWRYLQRVSRKFFGETAHQKYLTGLEETGISLDRIPLISEMDEKLEQFGWRAVPVVGFIPPAVFMEFLSLGVLPIACDMRRLEHLAYTPAPDIVHEAAGHAPIIADQQYADYLHQYGEISRKVIFSEQDMNLYEAIRNLSDTKEDPASTQKQIDDAQKRLDQAVASVDYVSEAAELARMSWWTIEYGLVGDLKSPKIYGAGLLSSIGEGTACLGAGVKKIPFSLDCIKMSYDITRPQPQLYVASDFQQLSDVLEELAKTLAFRRGGNEGLQKALRAKTVCTVELDSGLQIGGKLEEVILGAENDPAYLRFVGPCQLGSHDFEIDGHGAKYHSQGFSTPLGRVKPYAKPASQLSDVEIAKLKGRFEFESGVVVEGTHQKTLNEQGENLVITFENCTVTYKGRKLFEPEWGAFDMACGVKAVSVYGGPPDQEKYLEATGGFKQLPGRPKTNLTNENSALNQLYLRVRKVRESGKVDTADLADVCRELDQKYPNDWLLRLELLEFEGPWKKAAQDRLKAIAANDAEKKKMIDRGLALL